MTLNWCFQEYDAVLVRSATKVTADVLAAGKLRLKLVGRAGTGTDNIDVTAATQQGVVVMKSVFKELYYYITVSSYLVCVGFVRNILFNLYIKLLLVWIAFTVSSMTFNS